MCEDDFDFSTLENIIPVSYMEEGRVYLTSEPEDKIGSEALIDHDHKTLAQCLINEIEKESKGTPFKKRVMQLHLNALYAEIVHLKHHYELEEHRQKIDSQTAYKTL